MNGDTMRAIMRQEFEITLKDLRFVSMKCTECHTVVILDMDRKAEVSAVTRESVFALVACPTCGRAFDSALPKSVAALHDAYVNVPDRLRDSITFRTGISLVPASTAP
jgi:4-hydroxy-3-methylbut-2-en-1-yl diphosphate synthase IspG/GcpE